MKIIRILTPKFIFTKNKVVITVSSFIFFALDKIFYEFIYVKQHKLKYK